MNKITKTLVKLSAGKLGINEEIIVEVRVNLKGTALVLHAAGGLALMSVGSKVMKKGEDQAIESGIPFAQSMALGVTNQRILRECSLKSVQG
ncbi:MAG: hypothetical protein HRT57_06445 [Crocinitomicaceae bacterium]|nr:hypothetical protein [Crocinitomicaceae bacterium]